MPTKSTVGVTVAEGQSVGKQAEKIARQTKQASTDALRQLKDLQKQVTTSQKAVSGYLKGISLYSKEVGGDLKSLEKALSDYQKKTKETIDAITEKQKALQTETDEAKVKDLTKSIGDLQQELGQIQKAYTKEHKLHQQQIRDLQAVTRHYGQLRDKIEKLAEIDIDRIPKLFEGIGDGVAKTLKGEFKGVGGVVGDGIKASILKGNWKIGGLGGARGLSSRIAKQESIIAEHGPGAAESLAAAQEIKTLTAAMGRTTMALGAMAGAFVVLVELFKAVDGQAVRYNQTLTKGLPLAGEMMKAGVEGAKSYTEALGNIREQLINDNAVMFKDLNVKGEEAASIMNDYISKTTGSISRAVAAFQNMSDPGKAVFEITKSVVTYGRMMGVSTEEVTSMMGTLTQELGSNFHQINHIMDSVVSAALSSGVPVNKFVGMFKDMLPTIDLFNNRLDETVGVMKQLGKAMSPDKLRSAMQALTKGFSGRSVLDMTQLALKAGTGISTSTADSVIADRMAALSEDVGLDIKKIFEGAKTTEDVKTRTAELQSMMQALGKDPAQIEMARQLGRLLTAQKKYQAGEQAGIMDVATVLKEGGGISATLAIYSAIQKRFNLGSMTGLQEHVFDTLSGVSEEEKKAILQLQSVLKQNMTEMSQFGQLADVGLQKSLEEVVKEVAGEPGGKPVDMAKYFETLTEEQKGDLILKAMRRQETKDTLRGEKEKKARKSIEDLNREQINATRTVGDYLNGVLTTYLEKFLNLFSSVVDTLKRLITFESKADDAAAKLTSWATETSFTGDALSGYSKLNRELIKTIRDKTDLSNVTSIKDMEGFFSQKSLSKEDTSSLINSIRTMPEFKSLSDSSMDILAKNIERLSSEKPDPEAFKSIVKGSMTPGYTVENRALLMSMLGSRSMPGMLGQFSASTKESVGAEEPRFEMSPEMQAKLKTKAEQFMKGTAEIMGSTAASIDAGKRIDPNTVGVAAVNKGSVATVATQPSPVVPSGGGVQLRPPSSVPSESNAGRSSKSGPRTGLNWLTYGGWGWLKDKWKQPGALSGQYKEGWEKARRAGEDAAKAKAEGRVGPTTEVDTPYNDQMVSLSASAPAAEVTVTDDSSSPVTQLADMFKRVTDNGVGMKLHDMSIRDLADKNKNSLERSLGNLVRVMAKMEENPEYRKALASDKITRGYSADVGSYANMPMKTFTDWVEKLPEAATGGYVAQSGAAIIHRGENIIPAGKGGAVTVNINMTANTNATAEQISAAIYQTFRQAQN